MIPIWVTFYLERVTFRQLSIIDASQFLTTIILELPSGALADLVGKKLTIILGFVISGVGMIGTAFSHSFEVIVLYGIINGIGVAFTSGSALALIYDSLKEIHLQQKFSKVLAKGGIIFRTSLLASSFIGAYLYEIKYYLPYLLVGVGFIISALIYVFVKEPSIDTESFTIKNYINKFKHGARESFKNTYSARLAILYIIIFSVGLILIYCYEQLFAKWLGFSERQIGLIFALITLGNIIIFLFIEKIERIVKANGIIRLIALVPGIALLFAFKSKILGLIVLCTESFVIKTRYQYLDKYMNQLIDSKYRAAALSTLNLFVSLSYLIFVPLIAIFFNEHNIGPVMQILGIILIFLAVPLAFKITNNKNHLK
jgi:MFS family permease